MSMDKLISIDMNRDDAPRPEAYGLLAGADYRTSADQEMTDIASSSGSSPFPGTLDDMSLLESGLYGNKYGEMVDDYYRTEADHEAGKPVDPRLLSLLEFFRELYVRREELSKKIFPGLHDEFVELSKKIRRIVVAQVEGRRGIRRPAVATLQRSLSFGSPRTPANKAVEVPLRLERFRVRELTLEDVPVQGAPQGSNGGGGGGGGSSGSQGGGSK